MTFLTDVTPKITHAYNNTPLMFATKIRNLVLSELLWTMLFSTLNNTGFKCVISYSTINTAQSVVTTILWRWQNSYSSAMNYALAPNLLPKCVHLSFQNTLMLKPDK